MKTRKLTLTDDIEEFAAFAGRLFEEYYNATAITSVEQNRYMRQMFFAPETLRHNISEEGYEYFVLFSEGSRAGFAAVRTDNERLFLSKLYLDPSFRGKGLGGEALRFIEQIGRDKGLKAVWLTVNRANSHSADVYLHCGYQVVRTQDVEIGEGYIMNDFVLEKTL